MVIGIKLSTYSGLWWLIRFYIDLNNFVTHYPVTIIYDYVGNPTNQ